MWKTVLLLSLGMITGATGTYISTKVTTQVAVVVAQPCPTVFEDAGKTIDITGPPQGHLPSLSK